MPLSLPSNWRHDKKSIQNSTGISLQNNRRYDKSKQGKITLTDKGCLEHVVHMQCRISIGYKMQSTIGEPMLPSLLSSFKYGNKQNAAQMRTAYAALSPEQRQLRQQQVAEQNRTTYADLSPH